MFLRLSVMCQKGQLQASRNVHTETKFAGFLARFLTRFFARFLTRGGGDQGGRGEEIQFYSSTGTKTKKTRKNQKNTRYLSETSTFY